MKEDVEKPVGIKPTCENAPKKNKKAVELTMAFLIL